MNKALAREAQAAATERRAKQAQAVEQARKNLPANAEVRNWTIRKTADACRPLKNTDLRLLDQLAQYYLLYSNPNRPQGLLNQIRTQVEAAVASKTATPFENEISQYLDSQDGMLLCACRYLEALPLLREAEQALASGVFTLPASEPTLWAMPSTLAAMTALRGLGELKAGEVRRALLSALHTYDFLRDGWEPNTPYISKALGYADRLIEQVTDDAWPDTPYSREERERCVAAIGWHPSAQQLTDALFTWVSTDPASFYASEDVLQKTHNWWDTILLPIRNAGIYDRAYELVPLLGKAPFETSAQITAIHRKIPGRARTTQRVISEAMYCNIQYARRSRQADVARVAFALKDYQREHNACPVTLDGLTPHPIPALPPDPLSGRQCEYQSDGKTFTIVLIDENNHHRSEILWSATK